MKNIFRMSVAGLLVIVMLSSLFPVAFADGDRLDIPQMMESLGISGKKTIKGNGYYVKFESSSAKKAQYEALVEYLNNRGYTQSFTKSKYSEDSIFSSSEAEIEVFWSDLPKLFVYCYFHRHYSYQADIYQPSEFRIQDMANELGISEKVSSKDGTASGSFMVDVQDRDFLSQALAYMKQYGIVPEQSGDNYVFENDDMTIKINKGGSVWNVSVKSTIQTGEAPQPTANSDGSGSSVCPRCHGSKTVDCSNCSFGNCRTCGGSKGEYRYYSGTGYVWEKCGTCGGTGNCRKCGGTGKQTCGLCNGTGKIH